METFKKILSAAITFLTIILTAVIAMYLLSLVPTQNDPVNVRDLPQIKEDLIQEIQEHRKPSEFPDYDLIMASDTNFIEMIVAKDLESYAMGKDIAGRIEKKLLPKGKFQRMYLLILASVDHGKPLSVYDDVYLTFNWEGGHVRPNSSLKTPPSDISNLLFSAEALPYGELGGPSSKTLNVLSMFNERNDVGVDMFLSSARLGGRIEKFAIYYECQPGSECLISE